MEPGFLDVLLRLMGCRVKVRIENPDRPGTALSVCGVLQEIEFVYALGDLPQDRVFVHGYSKPILLHKIESVGLENPEYEKRLETRTSGLA